MMTILAALYVFLFLWRMCRCIFSDVAVDAEMQDLSSGNQVERRHSTCVAVVAV